MTAGFPVTIDVRTGARAELVNITARLADLVPTSFDGLCHVFCQHTTAGLTINENADPDVVRDILAELERLVPWQNSRFRHGEGNSAAHVKSSLVGCSVTVPVRDGHLLLGTWQGIFFCEFDGPRSRRVVVQVVPSA